MTWPSLPVMAEGLFTEGGSAGPLQPGVAVRMDRFGAAGVVRAGTRQRGAGGRASDDSDRECSIRELGEDHLGGEAMLVEGPLALVTEEHLC